MRPSILYRIASGLLLLFAIGHTLGFQQSDPAWGTGAVLESMQSSHFSVQGFIRTYWDFFLGVGYTAGVLYLFAAVLAWQLGGLPVATLASMRITRWGFAACFAAVAALSWRYLFWIPIVMSGLVAACLAAAAWSSGRPTLAATSREPAASAGRLE